MRLVAIIPQSVNKLERVPVPMLLLNRLKMNGTMLVVILILWIDRCHSRTCLQEAAVSPLQRYRMKSATTESCRCSSDCFRKCCATGFFVRGGECIRDKFFSLSVEIPIYDGKDELYTLTISGESNVLVFGHMGCDSYQMNPQTTSTDLFYIQQNGSLLTEDNLVLTSNDYCMDYDENGGIIAYVCFEEEDVIENFTRRFNEISMIISLPFLVATFTVYACLSDRNVHGNCLMCYVASLAVAYIFLVTILLYPTHLENVSCNVLAYICYIAFLASFFWMNAMCLDLFWAFSGKRGYGGDNKSQLKRFAFFNVYAWGIPFLLLIIVIILNGTMDQNSPIYPGIADKKCWFADGLPVFLYFYLIIAIILVINLGCFILTALQIRKVRQDTAMLHRTDSQRHSYDNDRHKFDLYLKLLLAMGINWTMEVISWAVEWQLGSNVPEELFYATDFCNACYGVIIFIIFVCNKEKRRRLRKWYYSITGRPMRAQSMSNSSQTTRITHAAAERTTTNDSALLRDPK